MLKHKKFNRIFSLNGFDGRRIMQHEEILEALIIHFQTMFTEPYEDRSDSISKIRQCILKLIAKDQNEDLMWEIFYA